MPIIYYPHMIQKKSLPVADQLSKHTVVETRNGGGDITSSGLSSIIYKNTDWKLLSISYVFSAATSRDFSMTVLNGRTIVEKLNDIFWVQCKTPGTLWAKITITPGFYTGTQLATELQTKLNASSTLTGVGYTFTVAYSTSTGLFTITPSTGQIAFWHDCPGARFSERISTAGHIFGFTENQTFASTVVSDTAIYGLNSEAAILTNSGSTVLSLVFDDGLTLSMDQALQIETSTAAIEAHYTASIQEL